MTGASEPLLAATRQASAEPAPGLADAAQASSPVRVIRPPAFSLGTTLRGLKTLGQYSDLLYTLSLFRLNVRYKQSVLGWAWAAIQPVALMTIYTFIFAHVTKVRTDGIPYPIFVFAGLLPWIFFAGSITNSVQGLVAYPSLLTKMYFPREIIPLSYLVAGWIDFLIASVILGGLLAYYRIPLTWNLLYGIPILILLAAFAAAMSLLFSAVHVRFRDVGLAMPFVLQVWMFATPVVYSFQSVPARYRNLFALDPVAAAIENFRAAVIYGKPPDLRMLGIAAVITLFCLVASYAYFKASESVMADVI
jgi:lipopolysaccharide transport system permease protein